MANIFSRRSNSVPIKIVSALFLLGTIITSAITYYATPEYLRVGYEPLQPVAFDHDLHVSQLGMDCRYCHTYVDRSHESNVPAASTCMNCHNQIHTDSPALAPIRNSYYSGEPVPWVRIHMLPDYVYFNHAIHVNRGISCVECHGDVHKMEKVHQTKPFSMAFCLECHRDPAQAVRPIDTVYNLRWKPENPEAHRTQAEQFVHDWKVTPPQSCSGCHR